MRKERAAEFRLATQLAAQSATNDQAISMPSLFPVWSGKGVAYPKDYIVRNGNGLFRCLTAHTSQESWAPGATPSVWVAISDPTQDWPKWLQPQGAHDSYAKGSKVSHNGKHWVSDVDGNVWEPGVHGWTEQA